MVDFNSEVSFDNQKRILERVEGITRSIREDVLDYYFENFAETEDHYRENLEGMRKYLKTAYDDLDDILTELDKDLGY